MAEVAVLPKDGPGAAVAEQPDDMATIRIINLTPLPLAVDMPLDQAPRPLRPFEAVDWPLWSELRHGRMIGSHIILL